mgnify:CR=1 FL=1
MHTHGRPRERAYGRLVEIYSERLAIHGVKLNQHSDKLSHDEYVSKLEAAAEGATLIILDENGETGTTEWFTTCWKNWKLSKIVFRNISLFFEKISYFLDIFRCFL